MDFTCKKTGNRIFITGGNAKRVGKYITRRTYTVAVTGDFDGVKRKQEQMVDITHCTSWPDFGVPETDQAKQEILDLADEMSDYLNTEV